MDELLSSRQVRLIRAFPIALDPLTAPDYLPRWLGLPRRPDPGRARQPNLLWQQMSARPIRFAEAEPESASNLRRPGQTRGPCAVTPMAWSPTRSLQALEGT